MVKEFFAMVTGIALLCNATDANAQTPQTKLIKGDGFTFSVKVPDKWKVDAAAAKKDQVKLAMLPEGESWETATIKIYADVEELDLTKNETIGELINFDKQMYKMADPAVAIFDEKPIAIENGKRYAMAIKVDDVKNGYQVIAYIPEAGKIPVVVMNCVIKRDFLANLSTFEQVVQSYVNNENAAIVEVTK